MLHQIQVAHKKVPLLIIVDDTTSDIPLSTEQVIVEQTQFLAAAKDISPWTIVKLSKSDEGVVWLAEEISKLMAKILASGEETQASC